MSDITIYIDTRLATNYREIYGRIGERRWEKSNSSIENMAQQIQYAIDYTTMMIENLYPDATIVRGDVAGVFGLSDEDKEYLTETLIPEWLEDGWGEYETEDTIMVCESPDDDTIRAVVPVRCLSPKSRMLMESDDIYGYYMRDGTKIMAYDRWGESHEILTM